MNKEIAIEVKNLSKNFRLPTEKSSSIKQTFINWTKGIKGYKEQKVLRNISFNVEKGDFFGIVGRNGSGKSTLLKLIADIYKPNSGSININGSLVSFIELGVGFNPELTGHDNIYLNGALLGFSSEEIDEMYDDIVEFAELGEFMDQKLKNYSSGMQVRLAFSCAIRAKSDILVLDEILAVGDEAFQRKCNDYFDKIKKDKNQTVVLVTHSMESVKQYCNKAMMIHNGKIVINGNPEDVAEEYSIENFRKNETEKPKDETQDKYKIGLSELVPKFEIKMISKPLLKKGDTFEANLTYKITEDKPVRFGISIVDIDTNCVLMNDWANKDENDKTKQTSVFSDTAGEYVFHYKWKVAGLNNRKLMMIASLFEVVNNKCNPIAFTSTERGVSFLLVNPHPSNNALLDQEGEWKKLK